MSFRLKTILGVALIEVTLLIILVWNGMELMRRSSEDQLIQRAETTAALFASMVKDGVLSYDLATLETFVAELIKNKGLVYVRIYDQDNLLASGGEEYALKRPFVMDHSLESVNDSVFDIRATITEAEQLYGRVELGLSTTVLEEKLEGATIKTSSLAVVEILLSALFSYLLGSWLVRQLEVLRHASSEIASGRLGGQIPVKGRDEIAETAAYFNQMSMALKHSTDELNHLNASLELQVQERTQQLEYANQSLQSIIQSMSEILLLVDEHHCIQLTNPASMRLLGYEESRLLKHDIQALLEEGEKERFQWMVEEEIQTGEEFSLLTASGERLPVLMMASRIDNHSEHLTVITAQDLRELKRAEEGERYLSFQEGLNEMSANILHNIGNNLAGIQGGVMKIEQQAAILQKISSLLGDQSAAVAREVEALESVPEPKSALGKAPLVLKKSAETLHNIATSAIGAAINDIDKLTGHIHSVIQATPLVNEKSRGGRDFEFSNLLQDVETILSNQLEEKQARLVYRISSQVGRVSLSRNILLQAMVHLVGNSLDALDAEQEDGEIVVVADLEQRNEEGPWLSIEVLDNGCGIPPELLDKVARSGFSTKEGSAGNGLHAVGNYINATHGEFKVSNRLQRGVSVLMKIPLKQ